MSFRMSFRYFSILKVKYVINVDWTNLIFELILERQSIARLPGSSGGVVDERSTNPPEEPGNLTSQSSECTYRVVLSCPAQ